MGVASGISAFLCNVLVSVAAAQAPGDGSNFCPLPTYPPNMRILMDSHHYFNLLPPQPKAVWEQVDMDESTKSGVITSWSQVSNSPCRQHVIACGFSAGPQDNWLITQHISRVVDGSPLPQVRVLVEFEYSCSSPLCEIMLGLYKYETSVIQLNMRRDTSHYQLETFLVSVNENQKNRQNRTLEINFNTNQRGFYLAFRDSTTCIEITRVLVFYNICPGGVGLLVNRPEQVAPMIDHFIGSNHVTVTVNCIAKATTVKGVTAQLSCTQGGIWRVPPGRECLCYPGHVEGVNGQECSACPVGTYFSAMHQGCRICPHFSVGTRSALETCPCLENFYRAPGERDLDCTQPPSRPHNLAYSVTLTTITLTWEAPVSSGGRSDIRYSVWYQGSEMTELMFVDTVNDTTLTIRDLESGEEYYVVVNAENGVSHLAYPTSEKRGLIQIETAAAQNITTNTRIRLLTQFIHAGLPSIAVLLMAGVIAALSAAAFAIKGRLEKLKPSRKVSITCVKPSLQTTALGSSVVNVAEVYPSISDTWRLNAIVIDPNDQPSTNYSNDDEEQEADEVYSNHYRSSQNYDDYEIVTMEDGMHGSTQISDNEDYEII